MSRGHRGIDIKFDKTTERLIDGLFNLGTVLTWMEWIGEVIWGCNSTPGQQGAMGSLDGEE